MFSRHKIIGEGEFGCTIKPHYKCPEFVEKENKTYVSKLVPSNLDEYNEMLMNKIRTITDYNKYYIIQEANCKLVTPKLHIKVHNKCKMCQKIDCSSGNINNNILEYGGINLKKFLEDTNVSPADSVLLNIMQKLSVGLLLLHEKNIVHRDIKPENIVVGQNNPNIDARYIDWGLTMCDIGCNANDMDNILGEPAKAFGTRMYNSPEILIPTLGEGEKGLQELENTYKHLQTYNIKWFTDIIDNILTTYRELFTNRENYITEIRYGADLYNIDLWKKNDIFMLGITFAHIVQHIKQQDVLIQLAQMIKKMLAHHDTRITLPEIIEILGYIENRPPEYEHKYMKYKLKYKQLKQMKQINGLPVNYRI